MFAALLGCCGCTQWPEFTLDDVREHNTIESLYLVSGRRVIDATPIVNDHPGGLGPLLSRAGGIYDCERDERFHLTTGREVWGELQVGVLVGPKAPAPPLRCAPAAASTPAPSRKPSALRTPKSAPEAREPFAGGALETRAASFSGAMAGIAQPASPSAGAQVRRCEHCQQRLPPAATSEAPCECPR
jgi:hypothetical protein